MPSLPDAPTASPSPALRRPPRPVPLSFRGAKRRTWGGATADQISSRDLGRWLQESAPPSPSPRRPDPHPPRTREREYPRTCPQAPLPFPPSPRNPRPGGAAFRPLSHPGGLGRKLRRLRSPPDTRMRTYLKIGVIFVASRNPQLTRAMLPKHPRTRPRTPRPGAKPLFRFFLDTTYDTMV